MNPVSFPLPVDKLPEHFHFPAGSLVQFLKHPSAPPPEGWEVFTRSYSLIEKEESENPYQPELREVVIIRKLYPREYR